MANLEEADVVGEVPGVVVGVAEDLGHVHPLLLPLGAVQLDAARHHVQRGGDLTRTAVGRCHHPVCRQHGATTEVCGTQGPNKHRTFFSKFVTKQPPQKWVAPRALKNPISEPLISHHKSVAPWALYNPLVNRYLANLWRNRR